MAGNAGVGDLIRKIISFVLLGASILALISLFIGSGTMIFEPIGEAFSPFNWPALGTALYDFFEYVSVPLIMAMLGLIGLTVHD